MPSFQVGDVSSILTIRSKTSKLISCLEVFYIFINMENKICTKGGDEKPIEEYQFKNKAKGLRKTQCKGCIKEYRVTYYSKNRDTRIVEFKNRTISVGFNHKLGLVNTVMYPRKRDLKYYKIYKELFD